MRFKIYWPHKWSEWRLLLLVLAAACFDYFVDIGGPPVMTAGLLTVLLTGAAVQTPVAGQSQLEQYIVVGDIDTTNPLSGIFISTDQGTIIDIQSQVLVTAFAKLFNQMVGSGVVGLQFKVATARIKGNTTYRFTNAGATTPNIYAYSISETSPAPVLALTKQINALSNDTFDKFSALLVINTNVASFDVTWHDGSTQNMTVTEMDALFAEDNQAEADGRLQATVTVCDNRSMIYQNIKINATSGGAVTVCTVKLPDSYFRQITSNN